MKLVVVLNDNIVLTQVRLLTMLSHMVGEREVGGGGASDVGVINTPPPLSTSHKNSKAFIVKSLSLSDPEIKIKPTSMKARWITVISDHGDLRSR